MKRLGMTWISNAWFKTQTQFKAMVIFVIARWWVRPPTQCQLWGKVLICGLVPDAYL